MRVGLFLVQSRSLFQGKLEDVAEAAARRLGVTLTVEFAEGNSATQRKQLFDFMRREPRPEGFMVQPVEESGLRFVMQEARQKGLVCAFINRRPAFLADLRSEVGARVFSVTPDNSDIGRLQAEQCRALLPQGGAVLYVTGPPSADSVVQRLEGIERNKGAQISIIRVAADWTREGGDRAIGDWLDTTRGMVPFGMVAAQNDDMALGARQALERLAASLGQPHFKTMPVTGVDGLPEFGQRLVAEKQLAATVIMPTTTGEALDALVAAVRGERTPEAEIRLPVISHPPVDALKG